MKTDIQTRLIILLILAMNFISVLSQTMTLEELLYLGQPLPTDNPSLFCPEDLLSKPRTRWHSAPVFSPDGNEMYYTIASYPIGQKMYFTKNVNGKWTEREFVPFAFEDYESNPRFSSDGNTIYFISQKKIQGQEERKLIYYTNRMVNGWSKPKALDIPLPNGMAFNNQFSFTEDMTFYFELLVNGISDLYSSKLVGGKYSIPKKLDNVDSESHDFCPYIDPQGKYLIFVSMRSGGFGGNDMYISFLGQDGGWQKPINLGNKINSSGHEVFPLVSNDGKYFFFNAKKENDEGANPYWVDAKFINDLRLLNNFN